jgi:septal ring factor EnvC (AmiA/AmiB activator)
MELNIAMLLLVFAIFVVAYLGFKNHDLKKRVEEISVTNGDLGKTIAEHIKNEALLRQRLTEATDNVASLKVVIDDQKAQLKHHEQLIEEQSQILEKKKPESTQYSVAPPDITAKKKVFNRDTKGHFIKK